MAIHLIVFWTSSDAHDGTTVNAPKLKRSVVIDGDLSDLSPQAWFAKNPYPEDIFDSGIEPPGTANTTQDITGEYYMAWDDNGIYLAVKAEDNVHDVVAENNTPWGWYLKDGCSWFF